MNRGKLLVPTSLACNVTEEICKMYLSISRDDILRVDLFNCNNSRLVFSKAVVKIMSEKMAGISCSDFSHKFVDGLLPEIAHSLFNCLLSNYAKETNSAIHVAKKRKIQDNYVKQRCSNRNSKTQL